MNEKDEKNSKNPTPTPSPEIPTPPAGATANDAVKKEEAKPDAPAIKKAFEEKKDDILNPLPPEETGSVNDIDVNLGDQSQTTEDAPAEEIEFIKNVQPSQKLHYETIIAANKKTIAALREENIGLHAENAELTKKVAELTFLASDHQEE